MSARHPLSSTFFEAKGASGGGDALERTLTQALDTARARWPAIVLDDRTFVRHLARHTPSDVEPCEWICRLCAPDLYLACGCADGDAPAITAFEQEYLAAIPDALIRQGASRDEADDVVQALRIRMLMTRERAAPRIGEYGGRTVLANWLRVAAVRERVSSGRADRARERRLAAGPPADVAGLDPELSMIQRKYAREFNAALREAFDALEAEQRHALRLQFQDGLNLANIARVMGVSRATAGRMVLAAREALFKETSRLLRLRLKLEAAELESLLLIVRARLEVSLRSALSDPP